MRTMDILKNNSLSKQEMNLISGGADNYGIYDRNGGLICFVSANSHQDAQSYAVKNYGKGSFASFYSHGKQTQVSWFI